MSEGARPGRSVVRGCLLPLAGGVLVGALVMWLWLQVGPTRQPTITPAPTPTPIAIERIVVLVVNEAAGRPVGLWQWQSGEPGRACVASNDYWVNPPGRTLLEILTLAQAREDPKWLASHAGSVATDCDSQQTDPASVVIIIPADGLAALVDALGGIQVGSTLMNGPAAWWFVADEQLTPTEAQERQRRLWEALSAGIEGQPDPCPAVEQSFARLMATPDEVDACQQLTSLLRHTPAEILTP